MRTTIDLPDQLMKQAKMKAIQEGKTLKEYFSEILEHDLSETKPASSVPPWKELQNTGSAQHLSPEDSGFEGYSGPDWNHAVQVNESKL